MSTQNFKTKLSEINNMLESLASKIETHHNLIADQPYQIHTTDGKTYTGFYIGSELLASNWKKKNVEIVFSFFKMKKDGKRSKLKNGYFIRDILNITELPSQ
mgnify:CR=1 FL=1